MAALDQEGEEEPGGAGTQDREPHVRNSISGAEPVGSTPEEFAVLLRQEVARWAEVVVRGAPTDAAPRPVIS
jgi:hypothetical protein